MTKQILIISGEGERGTIKRYKGEGSLRAIRARLTRERCGGDRWARALIYEGVGNGGPFGIDFESGEPHPWPEDYCYG